MPQEGSSEQEVDDPDVEPFVEADPSGRYGRYKEVLGKGAFKKVYRAFDEWEGIEVAWNQVKVSEIVRNSEDLERLYSEVHLLKTLKHKNIIKFYNSWVDTKNEHINFITEIFTSGTLRQYRKKHKRVELRALKKWSRQILEGLDYLHSHDPPIIHRDLKCDNIFVNGNHGEVKIGDLGFAAILLQAHAARSVIGTPEFMAPELYEEEYNELVDIYAFGMCVLELVTFEYPYAECSNAAQIYKKVVSGIKPASMVKVKDPSVKKFIEKCIADVSERLSAKELLNDPFLTSDVDKEGFARSLSYNTVTSVAAEDEHSEHSKWVPHHNDPEPSRDYMVEGERKDVNTIFIKLRIADSTGHFRNIHFPFDIEADTSLAVASEMVHELDLTDQDVTFIADRIDSEIRFHIPNWSPVESFAEDASDVREDLSPWANSSGRKFWLDSPRAAEDEPSSSNQQQNDNNLGCIESEQARTVAEKLEQLLQEQQKEIEETRNKHELAVSDLLKALPHKVRRKVFNLCKYKVPDHKMHSETATVTIPQQDSHSPIASRTVNVSKVKNLSSMKRGSKHDLGIAVILKDDLEES